MGLFDKKYCDVCGNKIGLLGNRKLEDGNLCKDCAKKLSPWFNERRHSTLAEIKDQLAYREANLEKVKEFNTTLTYGRRILLHLDEDKRQFLVAKTSDLLAENPDVLDYSQVTGCDLDIDESRTEIKREGPDGKEISYVPPRYTYEYDFYMVIRVNTPWFNEMRFKLNDSSVETNTQMARGAFMNRGISAPGNNPDYQEYERMGQEIKAALMDLRQQVREEKAAADAPKVAVTCPYCGATTVPDASGCCEYCGGAIGAC